MMHRSAMLAVGAVLVAATTVAALLAPQSTAAQETVVSNDGMYRVTYARPNGEALPLNERFALTVNVRRQDNNAPAANVELSVDASMPEHMHGMNVRPTVMTNDDGSFAVDGMLLHMPGRWEIYFDVKRRGITERAQVELFLE